MPVEIRELVLKITIEEKKNEQSIDIKDIQDMKNSIIKECTAKIMKKIESLSER